MRRPHSILIVGPTPPPIGGQTLMVQALIDAGPTKFPDFEWNWVRVQYSRSLSDTGRFGLRKVTHTVSLLVRIIALSAWKRPSILYYTPAGPTRLPMLRDMVVLNIVRPLFPKLVFHFHAGGVSEMYESLGPVARYFYRRAYFDADLGIKVAEGAPDDPRTLECQRRVTVPNGVPDLGYVPRECADPAVLLFVGLITATKGVQVLIEAAGILAAEGHDIVVHLVGETVSQEYREELEKIAHENSIADRLRFAGVLRGDEKRQAFAEASVLCFPTFFESETFGLVVAEAMSSGLPAIVTRWRGVADLVEDGVSGLVTAPRDPRALAEAVARLITNPVMYTAIAAQARQRYEENYTMEKHLNGMRMALTNVIASPEATA